MPAFVFDCHTIKEVFLLMHLSGNYFQYNGQPSAIWGLFFAEVELSPDRRRMGSPEYATQYNRLTHRHFLQQAGWQEPLAFEAEIVSDRVLSDEEVGEIYDWLFHETAFRRLEILSDEHESTYLNCVFHAVEEMQGGVNGKYGPVGFRATILCDAPWGWEDGEAVYEAPQLGAQMTFHNPSAYKGYLYPEVTIQTGSQGGDLLLQNITDGNRQTKFTGISAAPHTLTLLPETLEVRSSLSTEPVYDAFNKNFFRLLPGLNRFSVTGDVQKLTLQYRIARLI